MLLWAGVQSIFFGQLQHPLLLPSTLGTALSGRISNGAAILLAIVFEPGTPSNIHVRICWHVVEGSSRDSLFTQ